MNKDLQTLVKSMLISHYGQEILCILDKKEIPSRYIEKYALFYQRTKEALQISFGREW